MFYAKIKHYIVYINLNVILFAHGIVITYLFCAWHICYVFNLRMKPLHVALRCVTLLRYAIQLRYSLRDCVTLIRCVITLRYV